MGAGYGNLAGVCTNSEEADKMKDELCDADELYGDDRDCVVIFPVYANWIIES